MEAGRVGGGRSQERPKTFPRGRSLKVYRASRWSAINLRAACTTKNISKRREFEGVSRLPLVGHRPNRSPGPKKQYLTRPAFSWKRLSGGQTGPKGNWLRKKTGAPLSGSGFAGTRAELPGAIRPCQ